MGGEGRHEIIAHAAGLQDALDAETYVFRSALWLVR
jgi:hypothetical protein